MRVSELITMEMDDLFFEAGFIRVIGEGNKERLIPVGQIAQKAIEHYLALARPEVLQKRKEDQSENQLLLHQRRRPLARKYNWSSEKKSAGKQENAKNI